MERGLLEPNGSLETRKIREELSLETRQDWLHKVTPKNKMDVKSTFLYGTIEKEVYVDDIIFGSTKKSLCDEFEEDGIFISQDKYVAEILKKFNFATVKTASTPIETNKALVKDEEAEAVVDH
ncbi:hypothetical protein Tco_0041392 [Tanacetum coccineum]